MGRLQRSTEEHTVRSQIATPRYSIGTGFCTHGRTGYLFYSGTDRHVESRKRNLPIFINYEIVETYKDFGGIRNEEDYLITETGARRLGKKIPLTPEEVEALR